MLSQLKKLFLRPKTKEKDKKMGILKNAAWKIEKQPFADAFENKFLVKRIQQWCFSVNIAKFLRIAISMEHLWCLLESKILES